MSKITYTNKVTLNSQPSIADENKVTSGDMNEIKTVVNNNDDNVGDLTSLTTTNKTSLVSAINEVKSNLSGTILWTNDSPGSSMAVNTLINLSSSDYDILEIYFNDQATNLYMKSCRVVKGKNILLDCVFNQNRRIRILNYVTDTQYKVAGANNDGSSNAAVCIPIYIVGYKTGLSFS